MKTTFDGRKAYRHLEALTRDIGVRHGGSPNEQRAARYIRAHFRKLGLDTHYDPFPVYSFTKAAGALRAPDGRTFPCKAFPMTASTPVRGVTAPTVFLEDADPLCLDDRVTGRIVVTFNRFDPAGYERFLAYRPAALVSIQSAHNQLHVAAPWRHGPEGKRDTVPAVCMTYRDGTALLEDLPGKLTLTCKTTGEGWRRGNNVVAELPGTGPGDEVVVMCAHYDSVWTGPGAFDNGGGTAALMEMARVLKETGSPYRMRFCAFGGEEMGLWGSKGYVKGLQDRQEATAGKKSRPAGRSGKGELDRVRFVLNLDMMGMHPGRSNALVLGHPDIAASVRLLANRLRYVIGMQEDKIYSSDNRYFNLLGIPSLSFNRVGYADGQGHTEGDTLDKCCPEGLAHIAGFVESWIRQYLLESHVFPFPRELPPSARAAVDGQLKGRPVFEHYDRTALLAKARPRRKG